MSMNTSTSVVSISGEKLSVAARAFQISHSLPSTPNDRSNDRIDEGLVPNASADVLVQLRSNLAQLEELHARLRFVMSEVSYLIKRD